MRTTPEEDIVIEFKVRLSGLNYEQAQQLRNMLRVVHNDSTFYIGDEICALAQDLAPDATVGWTSPWAEWRPATGRRKKRPQCTPAQRATLSE